MPPPTRPEVVKAIRSDYLAREQDGSYRFSLDAIAAKFGMSKHTVCRLMTARGLSRYCTTSARTA